MTGLSAPGEMIMKVGCEHDTTPLGPALAHQPRPGLVASGTATSPADSAHAQDRVELSATGAGISALGEGADFDAAKVQAIQRAIREGNFHVNAGAIADRLIAEAQALVAPQTH
jgi:negative regulator of flagellin synthesis FlgM